MADDIAQNAVLNSPDAAHQAALADLLQLVAEAKAGGRPAETPRRWGAGHPRMQAVELPPPPGWHGDDKALQVDIAPTRREPLARPRVGAGAFGLPDIGPLPPSRAPQAELRSANRPETDWIIEKTGLPPMAAHAIDPMVKLGEATHGTAEDMAGIGLMRWAAGRGDALAKTASEDGLGLPNFSTPAGAQEASFDLSTPKGVEDAQRRMQEKGYYTDKVDGRLGTNTRDAIKRYIDDAPKRAAADSKRREQEGGLAKSAADAELAKAQAEAARAAIAKTQADENARRDKAASDKFGFEQLDEAEKARKRAYWGVPAAIEDNATAIGAVLGLGAGKLGNSVVRKAFNSRSAKEAEAANALVTGDKADLNTTVSDLNRFWTEGQQPRGSLGKKLTVGGTTEPPFKVERDAIPPFRSNANAPGAEELYRPAPINRLLNLGIDVAAMGAGQGEAYITHQMLTSPAERELQEAQLAVQANPNKATIDRLLAARSGLAAAHGIETFGRGAAAGYAAAMPFKQREYARPAVNAAEQKQMAVEEYLAGLKAKPAAPAGAPGGGGPSPAPGSSQPPGGTPPAPVQAAQPTGPSPAPVSPPAPVPVQPLRPTSAPEAPISSSQAPKSDIPEWARAKGATPHPTNPNQVRMPDGTFGTTIEELSKYKSWAGYRNAQARKAAKAEAESTAQIKPDKSEQSTNPPARGPAAMDEGGSFVKEPQPIQDDLAPYGRSSRPNGRHSSSRNTLLDLIG